MFSILFSLFAANQRNDIAIACRDGDVKRAESLVKKGVDLNAPTSNGFSVLYVAASVSVKVSEDNTKIVKILLENGANPNFKGEKYEKTVLNLAIMSKNVDVTKLLLEYKADPNKKGQNGLNPFLIATAYAQNKDIIDALLAKGADPSK